MRRVVAVILVGLLAGCGGVRGPKTVSVSGTVKLDGNPLTDAEVHFVSEKHSGFGKTDSQGKFKLVTGAEPGQNKIYFSKIIGGTDSGSPESRLNDPEQVRAAAMSRAEPGVPVVIEGEVIPPEYATAEASRLTFTVPDGGTDSANFDLDTPKK
jgi:hypothetical protein